MIFSVNLEVLSQMLDPAREKRDLHIRAAGIFVMQLELLEVRPLVARCHNEGRIVTEEPILATQIAPPLASKIQTPARNPSLNAFWGQFLAAGVRHRN